MRGLRGSRVDLPQCAPRHRVHRRTKISFDLSARLWLGMPTGVVPEVLIGKAVFGAFGEVLGNSSLGGGAGDIAAPYDAASVPSRREESSTTRGN
jgi:hypothetical protein